MTQQESLELLDLIYETLTQTSLLTVDPNTARDWINDCMFERQRSLRSPQVRHLVHLMNSGEFKRSELKFIKLLEDNTYHCINGQHRLHALVSTNKTIDFTVTVLGADTREELAQYYAAEDRGLSRSLMDTHHAFGLAEELGVPPTTIRAFSGAMMFIHGGLQHNAQYSRGVSDLRRIELLREWREEIHEFSIMAPKSSGRNSGVRSTMWVYGALAIELITLRYRRDKAHALWSSLRNAEGLVRETPAHTLFLYSQYRPTITTPKMQDRIARAFTLAWNNFYMGKSVVSIQPGRMKQDVPYEILGTPYNGKQWGPDQGWKGSIVR